jgi:hypothetical protein
MVSLKNKGETSEDKSGNKENSRIIYCLLAPSVEEERRYFNRAVHKVIIDKISNT